MVEIIFSSKLEQRQAEFFVTIEKKVHDEICVFGSAREGDSWNNNGESKGKVGILPKRKDPVKERKSIKEEICACQFPTSATRSPGVVTNQQNLSPRDKTGRELATGLRCTWTVSVCWR